MDNMCTVIAYFSAKPGRRAELKDILGGFVDQTREESGCINYDLHQSDEDPNVFVFYENWQSRKHWDKHNQPLPNKLPREADGLSDERHRGKNLTPC